ncbi:MAG: hypothetical protein RBT74_01165 [Tenuifilaceae bacterium]|jgi:hypothetical protein|nr:hypothetical protein [Tenuifilaceae bacterium]
MKSFLPAILLILLGLSITLSCQKQEDLLLADIVGVYSGTGESNLLSAELTLVGDDVVNIRIFSSNPSVETIYLNDLMVNIAVTKSKEFGSSSFTSWLFSFSNFEVLSHGNVLANTDSKDLTMSLVWLNGFFNGYKKR